MHNFLALFLGISFFSFGQIHSLYAHRGPYGLFQSIENRIAQSGLYFIQYYPLCAIRFIDSFQTVHKAPCVRKVSQLKILEVQGHRGARSLRPENTLPSFTEAIRAGADVLELDLIMTHDGQFIIYHDHFINPQLVTHLDGSAISSHPLLLHCLDLSQIKQFDCGRRIDPLFPQQYAIPETPIPTLIELFALIKNSTHPNAKKIKLNLEIKRESDHPEYSSFPSVIAKALLDLVYAQGFAKRVYYSSFNREVLEEIRNLDPHASIGFLKEESLDGMIETAMALKAEIVSPHHTLIKDADYVHLLQDLGFRVIVWTVNDPRRWEELINMQIDGIITDYPQDLIGFQWTNP